MGRILKNRLSALRVKSKEKVDNWNNFFISNSATIKEEMCPVDMCPSVYLGAKCSRIFSFDEVSEDVVNKHLLALDSQKATGCDEISAKFLKLVRTFICKPLTIIINMSIRLNSVPNIWKQANVIPLFKGGDMDIFGNFRPISVLPIMAKILERITYDMIFDHFTINQLFSQHQSGFKPGHSTQDVLLHLCDDWEKAMDKKLVTGVVFLDMKKAFDCVDHDILFIKLFHYGFGVNALSWIKDYFKSRKQRVVSNGMVSNWMGKY